MESLLLGLLFHEAKRSDEKLGKKFGFHQNRSTASSRRVHGNREPAKQSTSTFSWWGRNARRSGGNLSGKDVAAAEEFDANQLRLSLGYVHLAKMGFDETRKAENDRTLRLLQLFFTSSGVQNDSQYARLFASSTQSGESVGIGSHQSRAGGSVAAQESTEAPDSAREIGHSPCNRRFAGADEIHRHVDGCRFIADR